MIIPKPVLLQATSGSFSLSNKCTIEVSFDGEEGTKVAKYLWALLNRPPLEIALGITHLNDHADANTIRLVKTKPGAASAAEAYELEIAQRAITLSASTPCGLIRAVQSLYQIALTQLQFNPARNAPTKAPDLSLPGMRVVDRPRFTWRGMHLDVSRHFFSVNDIRRYIDLLATFKFNVFHWHLTDDQGWRIEIDRYPNLTRVGSKRDGNAPTRTGFYTKAQIRDVIDYAGERCIEVVPEIDVPGHTQAVLTAYPNLSCTGGPFSVSTKTGIHKDVLCMGNDDTFEFVEGVLDEVIALFPGLYIHLGGDECPVDRWEACAKCQRRVATEGLGSASKLQAYFTGRITEYVTKQNRTPIFWDEVLEGGLPESAALMSWRGTEHGLQAASMGRDVVMSPHSHCYFDFKQTKEGTDPGADWSDPVTLAEVYDFEPIPDSIDPEDAKRILGAQGNVWTERMPDMPTVESMILPRMCALAEVLWSDKATRNWADFHKRLAAHSDWLRAMHRPHESLPSQQCLPSVCDPRFSTLP